MAIASVVGVFIFYPICQRERFLDRGRSVAPTRELAQMVVLNHSRA